jgi:hypothetical protein
MEDSGAVLEDREGWAEQIERPLKSGDIEKLKVYYCCFLLESNGKDVGIQKLFARLH